MYSFTIRGYHSDTVVPEYVVNRTTLPVVKHAKDLGYHVTTNLKSAFHISQIVRPAHSIACSIHRAFVCKDTAFRVNMFNTFVRPKLEYASSVWSPSYKKDIEAVEAVQRRYTKRMDGLWNEPYQGRLSRLGIASLERRRLILDLCWLYKIINGLCDIPFTSLFKYVDHCHFTRGHNRKIETVRATADYRKHFFSVRIINTWNSLPSEIVNAQNLPLFKRKVKSLDLREHLVGEFH